ncbi:MAG: hypothetical protein B6D46_14985 [Polyangiaceae bacterium UTPRO1]|jgi:hypothetical protein|nr:DUF1566 domain-containing protein [Myxococcales bacterium]OQY64760.1 MAG: hypothetical protein B6D46_14985 [Polyangiaceae bacterium UTPRO1]
MTTVRGWTVSLAGGAVLLAAAAVAAAPTPAQKCQAGKNGTAGEYGYCRQKAEGKFAQTGNTAKYAAALAKCQAKYAKKWVALETKAGGACPTTGDQTAVQSSVDAESTNLAVALGGGPLGNLATCSVDLVTALDDVAMCGVDLAACEARGRFPATGQTTCWDAAGAVISCAGTGQDGDVRNGTALAYTDNGDGTVTDNVTKLMWEKLSDDGGIHDKDNSYTWAEAFAVKVATLNSGGGFAGHTDWRVPNVKELQSIVNYENSNPAVSPAFNTDCTASCTVLTCSCTMSGLHWSSSTLAPTPASAWYVFFNDGGVGAIVYSKTNYGFVRAVRGGP